MGNPEFSVLPIPIKKDIHSWSVRHTFLLLVFLSLNSVFLYERYMVMPEQPLKDMLKDTNLITKNKTTTEQIIFMKSLTLNCELGRIMIIYHECFTINQ